MNDVYSSVPLQPYLQISQKALSHNLQLIEKLTAKKTKILVPVKANAYGCGIQEILPFLQTAADQGRIHMLGVANIAEAKILRDSFWQYPILLLGGFFPHQVEDIITYNITPSITSIWQIEALQNAGEKKNCSLAVHLKLDTGMGRIGLTPAEIEPSIDALKNYPRLQVSGIFCHFPCADEKENPTTLKQLDLFLRLSENLLKKLSLARENVLLHAANSYSVLHFPQTHLDMVRSGIFFYGYFQNMRDKNRYQHELPLEPAVELWASPISLRKLFKGDTVSYGCNYVVETDELFVGVFPLGYADGVSRKLGNKISFAQHPLIGNVTMDQIILANIHTPNAVALLGKNSPPLELWADIEQTISYEVLTGFGTRLKRILV